MNATNTSLAETIKRGDYLQCSGCKGLACTNGKTATLEGRGITLVLGFNGAPVGHLIASDWKTLDTFWCLRAACCGQSQRDEIVRSFEAGAVRS